jgi:S-DNA-T family DNA segregation ATPase FtsK/SpoIIIE
MRDVAGPSFERQLISLRKPNSDEDRVLASQNNSSASLAAAHEDPMFFRAVDICLETRRGSVSLLQRRLAIGYTRASRLIDLMGIAGIISDHKGSVARDVLLSADEWDAMKQLAAKEAASQGKSISFDAPAEEQQALFVEPGAAPSNAGEAPAEDAVEEEAAVDEEEELEEDAVDEAEDAEESEEDSEEAEEAEELPPFPPGVEVRTRDQRPASGEPRGKRS